MALLFYKWFSVLLLPFLYTAPTFSKPHAHPFYVSVVEVAHNKAAATLEISCKLFAEDAEVALEKAYNTQVDFGKEEAAKQTGTLLNDYMQKHLNLTTDNQARTLQFAGFEVEAESLYCYFEVTGVPVVKTLNLHNSVLYDFTDKQINIMHVMVDGNRKSYKLDYPKTAAAFQF